MLDYQQKMKAAKAHEQTYYEEQNRKAMAEEQRLKDLDKNKKAEYA